MTYYVIRKCQVGMHPSPSPWIPYFPPLSSLPPRQGFSVWPRQTDIAVAGEIESHGFLERWCFYNILMTFPRIFALESTHFIYKTTAFSFFFASFPFFFFFLLIRLLIIVFFPFSSVFALLALNKQSLIDFPSEFFLWEHFVFRLFWKEYVGGFRPIIQHGKSSLVPWFFSATPAH